MCHKAKRLCQKCYSEMKGVFMPRISSKPDKHRDDSEPILLAWHAVSIDRLCHGTDTLSYETLIASEELDPCEALMIKEELSA